MPPGRVNRRVGVRSPIAALVGVLALASCAPVPPTGAPPGGAETDPGNAALAGIAVGPDIVSLGLTQANARRALDGFVESCPKLLERADNSALTRPADWRSACEMAGEWPGDEALRFFTTVFETARIADGSAFATGYFEPEIAGSRERRSDSDVPVYGLPSDLVRAWPDDVPQSDREGEPPLGRYDENGDFVRYFDRAAIEEGALDGRAPVIAYAADPVEFFFLQIQGSGRLRAPDGEIVRIGYAGQNGRGYTAIGAIMREQGLLGAGPGQYPASMQGIMAYLRERPRAGRELMRRNRSWVFFRELTGDGPLGALGVPVRARASVAVDPAFVPLGAPVWLDMERDEADGLWIAQDVGGAIKGANRFDTFWGGGPDARATAGTMSASGNALVLLPKGTVDRIADQP